MIAYLQELATRLRAALLPNLSVRALIQIKGLAQAHAMIEGRDFCAGRCTGILCLPLQHRASDRVSLKDRARRLRDILARGTRRGE